MDREDLMELRASVSLAEPDGPVGARRCSPVDAEFDTAKAAGQTLQSQLLIGMWPPANVFSVKSPAGGSGRSKLTGNPIFRASVGFGPTRRGAVVRPSHLSISGVCNISVPGTTRLVGCWSAYPLSCVVGTPRIWSYERPLHSGLDWAGNRWHCPVLEEKNDKLNG